MTTKRQVSANRQNAQLSTGPKTPAGKTVSRWNALRHGLRAESVVLPDEDPDDYLAFRHGLVGELRPAGEMEAVLVDRIVSVAWRLQRIGRVEAGLLTRAYFQAMAKRARKTAKSFTRGLLDDLETSSLTVVDEEAHAQALQKAAQADALADSKPPSAAVAFSRDSSDQLSKLARYETSLERSLYKALHELRRLQTARAAGVGFGPAVLDVRGEVGANLP